MCGLAGYVDARIGRQQQEKTLSLMMEILNHRGPDHSGTYYDGSFGVAHNRLAIIDLSDQANQPFHYQDIVVCLNGEIYNYVELREDLAQAGYRFQTQSDTEVLAAGYKHWGDKCVDHFIGMWAFVIWDPGRKRVFCSRDRFGIKPFYYILEGERFYFASEIKALKVSPLYTGEVNFKQVARGLQLGWLSYEEESYYQNVKMLPRASNLIYQSGKTSIHSYWDITYEEKSSLSIQEKQDRFRDLFENSVRLQMRSDVSIGACLSGGLDSSAIVSMMSHLYPEQTVEAFTIFYEGSESTDERKWVHEVGKQYPNVNLNFYTPDDNALMEAFENAHYHADVPLASSSPISQYFLMKLAASKGVKVLLDGQGSDEYLAGYMHTIDTLVGSQIQKGQWTSAVKTLFRHGKLHNQTLEKRLMSVAKGVFNSVRDEQDMHVYAYKFKHPYLSQKLNGTIPFNLVNTMNGNRMDNALYHQVFTASLPSLLHYEDRNSMAFGIESRVPFLDHRLVEFAFSLNDDDRIRKSETKYILRTALKGVLPESIVNRQDKVGFVTPGESTWLKGPLKSLMDIDFRKFDFLDSMKVQKVMSDYKAGHGDPIMAWRLVSLNYWLKKNL